MTGDDRDPKPLILWTIAMALLGVGLMVWSSRRPNAETRRA